MEGERMEESCVEKYKNIGRACVFAKYQFAASKWAMDDCPSLSACVSKLESCISRNCRGTDRQGCKDSFCRRCYTASDRCAFMASKNCEKSTCGDGECIKDDGETTKT